MNTTAATALHATVNGAGVRAPQDDIAPQHWQGGPIRCGDCEYAGLLALGEGPGCEPGHACMQDVYARWIDRFFRWHPVLSDDQLGHGYFEVRAIAARRASVFRLTALINDPDETVRLQVALRLPQTRLARLVNDPHREVRLRVAQRLEMPALLRMDDDPDANVRRMVAECLPVALLSRLAHDTGWRVRWEVAQRSDTPTLEAMHMDEEPAVRQAVHERLKSNVTPIGVAHG